MDISYWRELNAEFIDFLVEKGYTHDITRHYRGTINLLIRFANANGYKAYTQEIGEKFLESEERLMNLKQAGYQYQRLVIRRFNEYLDDGKYSYTYLRVNYECPEAFKEVLEHYLKSLEKDNLKQCTIDKHRVFTIKLCRDFTSNGIASWDAVDAKALSGAFDRATSKAHFAGCIRKLFGFLAKEGIVKYNYSGIVPQMHYWKRIPSVYSSDEIEAIIGSVDRSSAVGKRNYVILLLAARLGMRSSDISYLCFENVNFNKAIIEFNQRKTGVVNQLPLLPEIAEALQDYINNARGNSAEPHIFVTCRESLLKSVLPQLTSGAVCRVVGKHFRQSGIEFGDRHHGAHALRMSLASGLVAENVPYEAVRTILGHEDPNAITHYVKFDTESLRSCALNVPSASGRFAEYLASGKAALQYE
jgi:site-specific recombinase XerD